MPPKTKKRRVLIATNELGEIRAGGVATYIENLETMLEEEFEIEYYLLKTYGGMKKQMTQYGLQSG